MLFGKKEKVINLYFIYGANLLALFLLSASRLLIHFFKHKNHPILEWCVSAHCHEKWHAISSLFKVMCKCALFEKSNYDLFLLLYLFFIFWVLVLFFIAIGVYLLFKGSIFRSTAFL